MGQGGYVYRNESRLMRIIYWLKRIWDEIINAKLGLMSFGINFGIVYWVNHEHGLIIALISAFKDAIGKFFVGGFFGRISERFAEIRNPLLAYPLGSVVPTVIAYSLFFVLHSTTMTPEPTKSTIYPMLFSMFISTPTTIFVLRRGFMRQNTRKPAVKDRVWHKRHPRVKKADTPAPVSQEIGREES
jgi:hypothetical protein